MKFKHGQRVVIPACTRPTRVHRIAGWHPDSIDDNPLYILINEDRAGREPTFAYETALAPAVPLLKEVSP